jgi:elongation factor P
MHRGTFEQTSIQKGIISSPELLKEGQDVEITFHADTETPLSCDLPPFVILEVTYTEPGLKGDTSSSTALKPATVETGATINVPLFVEKGNKIKIDTRTISYSERVK